MNTSNIDIRNCLKANNIRHWKLAELLGISETTLVRKLRKELPHEEKIKILNILNSLKKGE